MERGAWDAPLFSEILRGMESIMTLVLVEGVPEEQVAHVRVPRVAVGYRVLFLQE